MYEKHINDLNYVRETMHKVMDLLQDNKISDKEKKNMVGVINALNNSAKILVSACLTEMAIQKMPTTNIVQIGGGDNGEN